MPDEGDFLPPINNLPPRPSTMSPPATNGTDVPSPPAAAEPRHRGRRRSPASPTPVAVAAPQGEISPPPIFQAPPPDAAFQPPPVFQPQPPPSPVNGGSPEPAPAVSMAISEVGYAEELPHSAEFSPEQLEGPRFHVGLGTTVNVGNFENIKYDVGLTAVPVSATATQLMEMMRAANARANFVMDLLGAGLMERVQEVREARGLSD